MFIKVAGLDCAFKNLGIAKAIINSALILSSVDVTEIELVTTEKDNSKQIRRNSDDLARSNILNQAVRRVEEDVDFVFAEIPHGAQSARAALAFGVAIGVLGGITKPLIEVQASEVKKLITGRNSASKDEVMAWAMKLYPNLGWKTRKFKGEIIPIDCNEHMADAIAIIHAGIKTKQFKEMVSLVSVLRRAA